MPTCIFLASAKALLPVPDDPPTATPTKLVTAPPIITRTVILPVAAVLVPWLAVAVDNKIISVLKVDSFVVVKLNAFPKPTLPALTFKITPTLRLGALIVPVNDVKPDIFKATPLIVPPLSISAFKFPALILSALSAVAAILAALRVPEVIDSAVIFPLAVMLLNSALPVALSIFQPALPAL